MSEVISWLGNASYGVAGVRVRADNPFVFTPTDISGLQIWLDGNDADAVNFNEFGTCLSWHNKGDLSGNFDLSGTADVRYGDDFVNGLNCVNFNANAFMSGNFTLNFQDRSLFIVSKRKNDISGGVFTWLTSDTTGGQESGISFDGTTYTYLLARHPVFGVKISFDTTTNTNGYAELATFINSSTDLSNNYVALNRTAQTLTNDNLASSYNTSNIPYYIGNYFGGSTLPNDYDLCELIMYNNVLSATDIGRVQDYLIAKWAIVDPPTPPFVPTDLAGLQVWLDASNASSLTLSGSDVVSWSNLGSASNYFAPGSNVATSSNSFVNFPTETTLEAYFPLPYYSRTGFCVFENKTDLTSSAYPYINLMTSSASDGLQVGLSYDSNASNYLFTICQNGTNCPVVAPFSVLPPNLNLVTYVVDSNSSSNTYGYLNNSSNLNTSSDLGNLFNQNPIPFSIGSALSNSPNFSMAEFIEYDSILSSSNIAKVKTYLSDKWGLGL